MYTVGLKRRWWFGYKEHQVKTHSWDGDKLLLDLVDGSQICVPGVRSVPVKVYPNFWIHLHSLPRQEPQTVAVRAPKAPEPTPEPKSDPEYVDPTPYDHVSPEVKRRAAERVRGILSEQGFTQGLPS